MMEKGPKRPTKAASAQEKAPKRKASEIIEEKRTVPHNDNSVDGPQPPTSADSDALLTILRERTRGARDLFESKVKEEAEQENTNALQQKYIDSAESLLGEFAAQNRKESAQHKANMLESELISARLEKNREDAHHKANMIESDQNTAFLELEKERGDQMEAEAMPLLKELARRNKEAVANKKLSEMVGDIGGARTRALTITLFDAPITVSENNRLHGLGGILKNKLTEAHILDSSTTPQKRNYMIDFLEKKLQALGADELKKLGFSSGNTNVIRAGDKLNLSILDKKGWIQQLR